ncbi:MAG: hypothetical protein FWG02_03215 [Holophagaceae bacterium]|nr:hypothetical protein [Holophagaceae bacterium]
MYMLLLAAALLNQQVIQIPEQEPETLELLEHQMLMAYDYGFNVQLPELPPVRELDAKKLKWLHSAMQLQVPVSFFQADTPEHTESLDIIGLLNSKKPPTEESFKDLSLSLTGSQLALWRFGQTAIRNGLWSQKIRLCWENRLMDESTHPIIRGLALRHALCWALAQDDENRLADLKNSSIGEDIPSMFTLFQKAFASLGGSIASLRLWSSSFKEVDSLENLSRTLWLCPDPGFFPASRAHDWIIPLLDDSQRENRERPLWREGAEQLLKAQDISAFNVYIAPFKKDLELLGIALFPTQLELDQAGNIISIKMGDACPRK